MVFISNVVSLLHCRSSRTYSLNMIMMIESFEIGETLFLERKLHSHAAPSAGRLFFERKFHSHAAPSVGRLERLCGRSIASTTDPQLRCMLACPK